MTNANVDAGLGDSLSVAAGRPYEELISIRSRSSSALVHQHSGVAVRR